MAMVFHRRHVDSRKIREIRDGVRTGTSARNVRDGGYSLVYLLAGGLFGTVVILIIAKMFGT
jgi:hypothetical protein